MLESLGNSGETSNQKTIKNRVVHLTQNLSIRLISHLSYELISQYST
jgi:hypothetical protein